MTDKEIEIKELSRAILDAIGMDDPAMSAISMAKAIQAYVELKLAYHIIAAPKWPLTPNEYTAIHPGMPTIPALIPLPTDSAIPTGPMGAMNTESAYQLNIRIGKIRNAIEYVLDYAVMPTEDIHSRLNQCLGWLAEIAEYISKATVTDPCRCCGQRYYCDCSFTGIDEETDQCETHKKCCPRQASSAQEAQS
jgi:hypothetical protein